MKIDIGTKESIITVFRKAGYGLLGQDPDTGEVSFARRAGGGDYPRFHAYVKTDKGVMTINLHLDQKKPSYSGSHAHNAEYSGELIEGEAERIRRVIASI